jgi:hypothetical protein
MMLIKMERWGSRENRERKKTMLRQEIGWTNDQDDHKFVFGRLKSLAHPKRSGKKRSEAETFSSSVGPEFETFPIGYPNAKPVSIFAHLLFASAAWLFG